MKVICFHDIPLSLKEACKKCKNQSFPEETAQTSHIKQSVSELGDQGDNFLTVNQLVVTSRSYHAYQRSVSSIVELSVPKRILRQRQLSLTEVSADVDIHSAGDGYAVVKKKLYSPIMKIKFVTEKMLQSNRIILVEPAHQTPCSRFSMLPYTKEAPKFRSLATADSAKFVPISGLEFQAVAGKLDVESLSSSNQLTSYHFLLEPSKREPAVKLDCAKWTSGKHRTVLALHSYRVSIVGYTKPSELKRDLNMQFKTTYPAVNITLSKLRSLERQMQRTAKAFGLQTGVLTCAKAYFERLVFASLVNKLNRHQVAATCLLLSAKVHGDLKSQDILQLVSSLEHSFKSTKSAFMVLEFPIFAALKFSLLPIPAFKSRNMSGEYIA